MSDPIVLNNWNMGGISESRILGENDRSLYKMVGTDVHSKIGLLQANRRLVKESGSTVDGFVKTMVACSDGYVYLFSSTNGKIWRYLPSAGTYSLAYTANSPVGDDNILGACEYNNYLYFATQNYLYRIQLDYTGLTWSSYVEEVGKLNLDPVVGDTGYLGGNLYSAKLYSALIEDSTVTFTNATEKVNLTGHGFLDGDKIMFDTTGTLPTGLVADTPYYVIAKATNDFQLTLTPICTATAVTFDLTDDEVDLTAHGLSANMKVKFATTDTLPTGITAGTTYYVKTVVNANSFTISATAGGAKIDLSGSPAGTHTVIGVVEGFTDDGTGIHTVLGNESSAFTPQLKTQIGVAIDIATVPSTSLTVVLHDASDTAIVSKTVLNASLTTGVNEIYWDTPITYVKGASYHVHVYQTGTGGVVNTGVADEFAEMYLELYGASNSSYHPMIVLNGILFIGDNNYIHQVENYLVLNSLDLPAQYIAKCLGKIGIDLLVGTEVANSVHSAMIFRWNTWSVSWSIEDDIEEQSINAFIPVDNFVYAVAGTRGNVYFYNGEKLELLRRIGGEFDSTDSVKVNPNAVASLHGIPLVGVSSVSGDALETGVYGMGTANPRLFPRIFDLEYVTSQGSTGVEIGSIITFGTGMLVAWKKVVGEVTTYGVDAFDETNLYSGTYIQTRVMYRDRNSRTVYRKAYINYMSVPDNTAREVEFDSDTDTVILTSHGFQDGEAVKFSETTGELPAELVAGTTYYVVNKTANTFQIAETVGGSAIDFTDDGTTVTKIEAVDLVKLYYRKDYGTSWTELTLIHDTDKKQFITEDWGDYAFCLEIKLELRAIGDESPVIDEITLADQNYGL